MSMFRQCLSDLPLIAILRGLTAAKAGGVGTALADEGFRLIEVPLNQPQALEAIEALAGRLGAEVLIGAGTVLFPEDVRRIANAGGRMIGAPNSNPAVVTAAQKLNLAVVPGAFTATEMLAMAALGVEAIRLFPAGMIPPDAVQTLHAVLPDALPLLPVGGIQPFSLETYLHAGATGFGIGRALYRPGDDGTDVQPRAAAFHSAYQDACRSLIGMEGSSAPDRPAQDLLTA